MNVETWHRVPETVAHYEVSTLGRLRKVHKSCTRDRRGYRTPLGYVQNSIDSRLVFRHVLVARTFHGEPTPGQMVRHLNGVPGDDRPENLAWGTAKENAEDSKRHGTNHALNKAECKWGHSFTEVNTFIDNLGRRICRTCKAKHDRRNNEKVSDERRARRHAANLARADRQVFATLPDESWLVRYGVTPSRYRYYREWPLPLRRNRVAIAAAELKALQTTTEAAA